MEVINYLKGTKRDQRLHEVVLSLAVEMLQVAGLSDSKEHAIQKITDVLDNGQAAETFQKMVSELGGPKNIFDELREINLVDQVILGFPVQWEYQKGEKIKFDDTELALVQRKKCMDEAEKLFKNFDFLVMPSAQIFPFNKELDYPKEINGNNVKELKIIEEANAKANAIIIDPVIDNTKK